MGKKWFAERVVCCAQAALRASYCFSFHISKFDKHIYIYSDIFALLGSFGAVV